MFCRGDRRFLGSTAVIGQNRPRSSSGGYNAQCGEMTVGVEAAVWNIFCSRDGPTLGSTAVSQNHPSSWDFLVPFFWLEGKSCSHPAGDSHSVLALMNSCFHVRQMKDLTTGLDLLCGGSATLSPPTSLLFVRSLSGPRWEEVKRFAVEGIRVVAVGCLAAHWTLIRRD